MKKHGFTLIELLVIIAIIAMVVAVVIGFAGCDKKPSVTTADQDMQRKTAQMTKEANAQAGMPAIKNYQEKKLAKMIYELRDQEKLVCYAYLMSLEGKPVFLGKCIGFGLPYCVQYSNPEKVVHQNKMSGGSFGTMPQPEPNGLFMPETLSATWLMMIDPKTGEGRPTYIEPEIIVSPFPLI